jgi:hypothetical protein
MSDSRSAVVELLPIDDLDREIVGLSARINAATYELLVLIRQFDERAGWVRWGFENCTEWLHWRCDLSMNAAREKVRIAHALKLLPTISAEFSNGELTYSKVRALTRAANTGNEQQLVEFALKTTTRCVEERCRELRCGTEASVADATRAHSRRSLSVSHDDSRGTMSFYIELPTELGQLVDKALDRVRNEANNDRPEFADESWSTRQADAFVDVIRLFLSGDNGKAGASNHLVTVHVDQSALVRSDGRSGLPVDTVKRLCCDGHTIAIVEDEQGNPLSVSRKTRVIPKAMERGLWARDKHCRFPGCQHKRYVAGHHIEHWVHGGETSLENLMLLCSRHHRLVHEGGFRIDKDYKDRWCFYRPDGIAVPRCGYHASDMTDDDVDEVTNAVNNPPRGGLLSDVDRLRYSAAPPT